MMSKRIFAIIAALFAAIVMFANPAMAGNPHFIKNATGASVEGTTLTVTFKEAGLPSGATETITVSALVTATFQCVNNGGKVPSDPKKTEFSSVVEESED